MKKGKFIVIDGIAGSGKSTVLREAKNWVAHVGKKIFDLENWSAEQTDPPSYEQVNDYDVYFTFEPTKTWIGSAIRRELSRTDAPYAGRILAQAFALDRLLMYRRLILPALEDGKTVIQDRSVTSSLVYQPLQDPSVTSNWLESLEGNALALAHAPDVLILTCLDPALVVERFKTRTDVSKGVYQDPLLLKRVQEQFSSPGFRELMRRHQVQIEELDTALPLEQTLTQAKTLFEKHLSLNYVATH